MAAAARYTSREVSPSELAVSTFASRLAMAALLGILIGFERQWRQRSAGLHTSSLVAVGAALFALLDTMLNGNDSTRVVAGVVTGVGFIAAGVIMRAGANVIGLNTAATIWATAAVGALAGFGLWWQAAAGAAVVIFLNLVLQPLVAAIDARAKLMQESETAYRLTVQCDADAQPAVSSTILTTVSASPLRLDSLTKERAEGDELEVVADMSAAKSEDRRIEELSGALLALGGVRRSEWTKP